MSLPSFSKVQVADEALNRMQDRIKTVTDALVANRLLDGVLLENVVLTAGVFTPVSHQLARPWQGYLVFARNANATIWSQPISADGATFLYLQPSATVTVNLWVF